MALSNLNYAYLGFAIILIIVSVFLIAMRFLSKDEGVRFHDEWEETKVSIADTGRKKNIILGVIFSFGMGYLVTGRLLFAAIALVATIPIANYLGQRALNKKKALLEDQYTQVLNIIITSLQGTSSNVYKVLEETVASLKNPAREVFVEILRRSRTGTKHYEAIGAVAEETGWQDLKQLEMAFRLYDTTGSNLQQVCMHLLKNAYDRKGNKKYVEATTAQIRGTALVLSIIPFFLITFMRFVASDFIHPLFYTVPGIIVFSIIILMVYTGNRIVSKMVKGLSA